MTITVTITEEGVALSSAHVKQLPLGSAIRNIANSEIEAAKYLALDDLWQEGLIEQRNQTTWLVPFDRLLSVAEGQARTLELPRPTSGLKATLAATGIATQRGFKIDVEVIHPVRGKLSENNRVGPAYLQGDNECVLLDHDYWNLAVLASNAPAEDAQSHERFEYLGRCVKKAQEVGAEIDSYLASNAVEVIDSVGVDLQEEGDEISIAPRTEALTGNELLLPNGKARPFPVQQRPDGTRRRFVVSTESREKITELGARKRVTGADVPRFIQNPEAYLPEGIDLADFSDRVRGFQTRVYNSRPYLHVAKEPRGWLDDINVGIHLEDSVDTGGDQTAPTLTVDDYRTLVDEASESGDRFVKHGDGWVEIDPEQAKQFIDTVDRLQELRSQHPTPNLRLILDVIPNVEILEFDLSLPEIPEEQRPWISQLPSIRPPESFKATLDSHQLLGFRWLVYLNGLGAGGLLADEMGVGKTAQVIALIAQLFEEKRLSPSLIVLPKTLIDNWQRELMAFAPGIDRLHIHAGPGRSRSEEFLKSMNIVLTAYETARIDQVLLGKIDWQLVVSDEAQFIKNPTAGRTSALKAMKAKQPIALTGTPVENGLLDFWCIIDYVQPGLLNSWAEFRSGFERPLTNAEGAERDALVEQLLGRLDPHFLRRMKDDVLSDLPPKVYEEPRQVPPGELQGVVYQEILTEARNAGGRANLGAITRLLITCAHPRAATKDWHDTGGEKLITECPKLGVTMDILSEIAAVGEKALLFTNWKDAQAILQRAIYSRFEISAEIVNGDVTSRREMILDRFRESEGFNVLILAPEVVGYGVNLTEANHVIHYTRPWNPAKEEQATDRAHRRGQTKPVTIYYPTVAGTVEETLADLLAEKRQLAKDVLRPTSERTVTLEELNADLQIAV